MVFFSEHGVDKSGDVSLNGYFDMRYLIFYARTQQLGLARLELRRLQLDLLFCYRIVFGLVSAKREDLLLL